MNNNSGIKSQANKGIGLPKVLVLMAAYNGEKYIEQQLDSIFAQKNVDVYVAVADDDSTDETIAVLSKYAQTNNRLSFVENSKNKGFTYNFLDLIFAHKDDEFDYFACSDQDDYWLPEKLSRAISFLGDGVAKLYCSQVTPVNKNLIPLASAQPRPISVSPKDKYINAVASYGVGHTEVWNRPFMKTLTSVYPHGIHAHDVWLYLVGAYVCSFYFDTESFSYYRQHESNAIASAGKKKEPFLQSQIENLNDSKRFRSSNVAEFLRCFGDRIDKEDKKILEPVAFYRTRFKFKMKLLFSQKYRLLNRKSSYFKIRVLLNKL
jgi:glycosyltransferase involved in cell wall biosynthesis